MLYFGKRSFQSKGAPLILRRNCSYLIASLTTLIALLTFTACNSNNKPTSAASPATSGSAPARSSSSSSSSGEIDACKLVTKAEAEEVMGEKLKDPDSGPASMAGGTVCRFESPESLSAKNVTIRVESPNFKWDKFKEDKRVEGEKMQPQRGYIRQVPGLGKDAYFARHALHVLTDHGILTVIVFKAPGDAVASEAKETKAEAAEKTLAEKAVPRM
jgi:hypothetical protein